MTIMVASIWYTSFPYFDFLKSSRRVLPFFLRDLPASLAEREEDSDDDESFHDAPRWFEFPAPFGFLLAFASALRRLGKAVVVPFARQRHGHSVKAMLCNMLNVLRNAGEAGERA